MAIRHIKFLLFFLSLLCPSLCYAEEICIIQEIFKDAKQGEWVLTQSKKGYQAKTRILKKQGDILSLEIENIIKGKKESKTVQDINLAENKIVKAEIISGEGEVTKIPVSDLLLNKVKITKHTKLKEEKITVPAGTFKCKVYKTIVDDKVVYLWLNEDVPVNHIVKAKIRHSIVKLISYGKDEINEKKPESIGKSIKDKQNNYLPNSLNG